MQFVKWLPATKAKEWKHHHKLHQVVKTDQQMVLFKSRTLPILCYESIAVTPTVQDLPADHHAAFCPIAEDGSLIFDENEQVIHQRG